MKGGKLYRRCAARLMVLVELEEKLERLLPRLLTGGLWLALLLVASDFHTNINLDDFFDRPREILVLVLILDNLKQEYWISLLKTAGRFHDSFRS